MKLHKYSLKQLKTAFKTSTSLRQVLIKVNVVPYGGNYDVLKKAIKHFNLDTNHFAGQAWNKGLITCTQGFNCETIYWLGEPIPLELDHINGNNKDNRLINLHLFCPNCHTLTPTYRSKNRTNKPQSISECIAVYG